MALALGDALAVALLEGKGFRREDFAALHPGGLAGTAAAAPGARRDASTRARSCPPEATMRDAVVSLAHDRGLALVGTDGTA